MRMHAKKCIPFMRRSDCSPLVFRKIGTTDSCLDFTFFTRGPEVQSVPSVECVSVMNPMRTSGAYINTEGLPNQHYSSDHLPIGMHVCERKPVTVCVYV
jgi:hypothetical protein